MNAKYVRRIPREGPPIKPWLVSPDDNTERFLYDLVTDPYELNNRVEASENATTVDEFDALMMEWDAQTPWLTLSN